MIRREKYDQGTVIRTTVIDRDAQGDARYRRWDGPDDGAADEVRPATAREEAALEIEEDRVQRRDVDSVRRSALTDVMAMGGGRGVEIVDVLIAYGVVPLEDARAAGWIRPSDR